jgi:hypothetical protein
MHPALCMGHAVFWLLHGGEISESTVCSSSAYAYIYQQLPAEIAFFNRPTTHNQRGQQAFEGTYGLSPL